MVVRPGRVARQRRLMDRRVPWAEWYSGSLEAGRPLTSAAEIIYFAGKAKQRLHVNHLHVLGVADTTLDGGHLTRQRGIQKAWTRKTLSAYQFVDLVFKGAAFALHVVDARRCRRSA
jgi:hypothetical protein